MGWIPARADTETDVASFILTAGMIPLDQASPVVGMAGTGLGPTDAPRPVATVATRAHTRRGHPRLPGRWREAAVRPAWRWLLAWAPSSGFEPTGEGATGGTGLARQMARAVVLEHDTGHNGLQHFRPAEFRPQVPLSATAARRTALAGLAWVGHGVPICPRSVHTVRLARFSPTVRLA